MNSLTKYYDNSITNASEKKGVVHVNIASLPKSVKKWSARVGGKVWVSEDGFIVENGSYVAYGKHVREFYVYRSQDAFDRGVYFDTAPNLLNAKIKAENLTRKQEG